MNHLELQHYTNQELRAYTYGMLAGDKMPIWFRTEDDIKNKTPLAFYNAADLNRVNNLVERLAKALNDYGYTVKVTTITGWQMWDIPFADVMATYLDNVQKLVDIYYTMLDATLLPVTMQHLDWHGANAIERSLKDIEVLLYYMAAQFTYCGEVCCGE